MFSSDATGTSKRLKFYGTKNQIVEKEIPIVFYTKARHLYNFKVQLSDEICNK
jgi:hypothetical protein